MLCWVKLIVIFLSWTYSYMFCTALVCQNPTRFHQNTSQPSFFLLRNNIFTDVLLQAPAHLVIPLSLSSHRQHSTALPFCSRRLLLGAIPVEVADRQAVDVHILAFFHYVCHTNPEVPGSWGTSLCIVPQLIVLHHVPWCCKCSSLSYAVFICLMVMFGLLNCEITLSVSLDTPEAHWKQKRIMSRVTWIVVNGKYSILRDQNYSDI